MQIYSPQELDTQTLIAQGAYQRWIFGPSLLDENGKAKKDFLTWDYIRESQLATMSRDITESGNQSSV